MTRRTTAVRRLTALAAVPLLAVLVAPPAGAAPAAFPDQTGIDPAALPRGPAPTALHTEGTSIVDGRATIQTNLTGRLQLVGRAAPGAGYVVASFIQDGEVGTLWRVRADGSTRRLRDLGGGGGFGSGGHDARTSPDGRRVAWTEPAGRRTLLRVARTSDGSLVGQRRYRGMVEVLDVGGQVLLAGGPPKRTIWYRAATDRSRVVRGLDLWSADLESDRAVRAVPDEVNGQYDGICVAYLPLSAPSQELWRSCTDKPLAFSPDGRLVISANIEADGRGTGMLQVRTAETFRVRATLRTGGFFGDPYWEDDDSFLVHTWRKGKAAIVRVSRDGTIERVSEVASEPDGDDKLGWSFPPS